MQSNLDYIYNELRETRTELLTYLNYGQKDERILHYIKDELRDIEAKTGKDGKWRVWKM